MKYLILCFMLISAPLAAMADELVDRIGGVYRVELPTGTLNDGKQPVNSILELVKIGATQMYVRSQLAFYTGQQCEIHGWADQSSPTTMEFHDGAQGASCDMTITLQNGKLSFAPNTAGCAAHCGQGAVLNTVQFPLTKKRTIRYLKDLVQTHDYKETMVIVIQKNAETVAAALLAHPAPQ